MHDRGPVDTSQDVAGEPKSSLRAQERSAARWVPVGNGLTHKLTDLRSWLLNCRSSLTGASSSS